jgi:hypothetical protein
MLFGNGAHRRVDIDIGVMVARFAVREGEAAGTEDQNPTVTKAEFIEQEVADVPDVEGVAGRFGLVDQ